MKTTILIIAVVLIPTLLFAQFPCDPYPGYVWNECSWAGVDYSLPPVPIRDNPEMDPLVREHFENMDGFEIVAEEDYAEAIAIFSAHVPIVWRCHGANLALCFSGVFGR